MNNRNKDLQKENLKNSQEDVKHPLKNAMLRTVATGSAVGVGLYPLGVISAISQTTSIHHSQLGFMGRFSALTAAIFSSFRDVKTHRQGLPRTMQASTLKNTVIANSSDIHKGVRRVVGEEVPQEGKMVQSSKMKELAIAGAAASLMTAMDTGLTTYPSTLALFFITHGSENIPALSLSQKYKIATTGIGARFSGNFANSICFLASYQVLQPTIEKFLPADQYGITSSESAANILAAIGSGVVGNAFKCVLTNTVKKTDLETLESPSSFDMTKKLFTEGGIRSFGKGGISAVLQTFAAYQIISFTGRICNDKNLDKMWDHVRSEVGLLSRAACGLFSKASHYSKEKAVQVKNILSQKTDAPSRSDEGPRVPFI